jgi:hypothetical protein
MRPAQPMFNRPDGVESNAVMSGYFFQWAARFVNPGDLFRRQLFCGPALQHLVRVVSGVVAFKKMLEIEASWIVAAVAQVFGRRGAVFQRPRKPVNVFFLSPELDNPVSSRSPAPGPLYAAVIRVKRRIFGNAPPNRVEAKSTRHYSFYVESERAVNAR